MWTLIKHIEKKLDGNYIRMLHGVLNKSWKQLPTKQQLYSFPPHKLFWPDKQDVQATAGEARVNSEVMFSYGQLTLAHESASVS